MKTSIDSKQILHELNIVKKIRNACFRIEEDRTDYNTTSPGWKKITFDNNVIYDPLSKWNETDYEWLVPFAGRFNVSASLGINTLPADGFIYLGIFKNSSEAITDYDRNRTASAKIVSNQLSGDIQCNAGDLLSCRYQAGGAYNLMAEPHWTFLTIHCIDKIGV